MWPTRMPARLIVDSSVSSDHDTAPANFRSIFHDPQCQLQVSQAQLTDARSSNVRSPPVTTLPSAPIPVSVPQPGPSSSGQNTDFQAMLASVLQQMSGTTQLGPENQSFDPGPPTHRPGITDCYYRTNCVLLSRPAQPTATATWDPRQGDTDHYHGSLATCIQHIHQCVCQTLPS